MDYPILLPDQLKSHLKSLRKARGLTQLNLGRLLGLGQVRVAEIEANPAAISVDQLLTLLSALNVGVVLRENATKDGKAMVPKPGRPATKASKSLPKPVATKSGQVTSKSNKGRW
jgi:HTH-type transcriptional regulator / antitoxin HipB